MTAPAPADPFPTDADLRRILSAARVVACVGFSPNPARPSHSVARYLQGRGLRVIPVNPGQAGKVILGEVVRASLGAIPEAERATVDFLDLFRRSEAVPAAVAEALEVLPNLRTVWMQLGVSSPQAAALARAKGVEVVMNRCPAIEFPRLFG